MRYFEWLRVWLGDVFAGAIAAAIFTGTIYVTVNVVAPAVAGYDYTTGAAGYDSDQATSVAVGLGSTIGLSPPTNTEQP